MENLIPIEAIQERDVDLLLLEELYCSKDFRGWFIENTFGSFKRLGKFSGVWHSLSSRSLGENDLVLKFSGDFGKGFLFLIENKIDAEFQHEQQKRYRLRGEELIRDGECGDFATVLFAPSEYVSEEGDFDFVIEYEQVRDWFLKQGILGERAKYKSEILTAAIEKLRRGYCPIRDPATTEFWRKYWELVNQVAPELNMREPRNDIPKGSGFFVFKPEDLKGHQLYHKAPNGYVDLEFAGQGEQIEQIKEKYQQFLEDDMSIERTHKSAVVRICVDKLDLQNDFDNQKECVCTALETAKRLYNWMKSRKQV